MAEKNLINRAKTGVDQLSQAAIRTGYSKMPGDNISKVIAVESTLTAYKVGRSTAKVTAGAAYLTGALAMNGARFVLNRINHVPRPRRVAPFELTSVRNSRRASELKVNGNLIQRLLYNQVSTPDEFHKLTGTVENHGQLYSSGKDPDNSFSSTHFRVKPKYGYEGKLNQYTGKKAAVHDNYTGLKRFYYRIDDAINGKAETVIRFQKRRLFDNRGKVVVYTRKPFSVFSHRKKIGKWKYNRNLLTERQYAKMASRFNPDLLRQALQKSSRNMAKVALVEPIKATKEVVTTPVKISTKIAKQELAKNDDFGSRIITQSVDSVYRFQQAKSAAQFTSRVASGAAKTSARVVWNTPKVAVKTAKAVAHPVRTTKKVGSTAVMVVNNVRKRIVTATTTTLLPFLCGALLLFMILVVCANTLGAALSFIGHASYSAEADSFKVLTDTISKLDATYQKELDTGDFEALKKHVVENETTHEKEFNEVSSFTNKIDESKVYNSSYAWDGKTIKKENWTHTTNSKIHSDRSAFFDYINAKYQESIDNGSNYAEDVDEFMKEMDDEDKSVKEELKSETSGETKKKEIKQYSITHVENDVKDTWGTLQYLTLEVTNEDDTDKPIFNKNENAQIYKYENDSVTKSTETLKWDTTHDDSDGDTWELKHEITCDVYKTHMRFNITELTEININIDNGSDTHKIKIGESNDEQLYVDYIYHPTSWTKYDQLQSCTCGGGHGPCKDPYSYPACGDNDSDYYYHITKYVNGYPSTGFVNMYDFEAWIRDGKVKPYQCDVDFNTEYYLEPKKDDIGNDNKIYWKVTMKDGYGNYVGTGYINKQTRQNRWQTVRDFKPKINRGDDFLISPLFEHETFLGNGNNDVYEWTKFYEQIYKCKETHSSTPLRWYLDKDETLKEAMTLNDRSEEENDGAIELYNAFLEFESNASSFLIKNIYKDKIVATKLENGYRYDETKNDLVWNELEVYSESSWQIFTPINGDVSIEKPFTDEARKNDEYLVIEGAKEWNMGTDKSLWKSIKEKVKKFFKGEDTPPPYKVARFYIKLDDINLDSTVNSIVTAARNKASSGTYLTSERILGTCKGDTLHIIPTYAVWDGSNLKMEQYDLDCYMEAIAMSVGAISENRLSPDSSGYALLEAAEKYKDYNFYSGNTPNLKTQLLGLPAFLPIKKLKFYDRLLNGDDDISFSSAGFIKKAFKELEDKGYKVNADLTMLSSENDIGLISTPVAAAELQTGDIVKVTPNGQTDVKYLGIVADPLNHTMIIQEDAFTDYVHYSNWTNSQWSGYNMSFCRIDIKDKEEPTSVVTEPAS